MGECCSKCSKPLLANGSTMEDLPVPTRARSEVPVVLSTAKDIADHLALAYDGECFRISPGSYHFDHPIVIHSRLEVIADVLPGGNQDMVPVKLFLPTLCLKSMSGVTIRGIVFECSIEVLAGDNVLHGCCVSRSNTMGVLASSRAVLSMRHCLITNNRRHGFLAQDQAQVTLDSTKVLENGGAGIVVSGDADLRAVGCAISNNRGNGVSVDLAASVMLSTTEIMDNGGSGLFTTNRSKAVLRESWCVANKGAGVIIAAQAKVQLIDSKIINNKKHGIVVGNECPSPHVTNCRIETNGPEP